MKCDFLLFISVFSGLFCLNCNGLINSTTYNDIRFNNIVCNTDRLAVYKVILHTYWTRTLFPKHYPDWRPLAQWTKTFGLTHNTSFNLYRLGNQASPGIKVFVETGHTELLETQTKERNERILDEFNIPSIVTGEGRSESRFFVDGNHSFVSLITRIVPSPDWFIGLDTFQLCVGESWIDSVTVEMDPLDAGTDNGFTFTAPNWPTEPQGIIYRITSGYPAHPAGSFYYPNSKRLPSIATFQFIKVKEYELSDIFNHIEDDRKYETVKTKTHLESEKNHLEINNELSADIEQERQYENTPLMVKFTEKDKVRARLLESMNIELNLTSNPVYTPQIYNENIFKNLKNNYKKNKFRNGKIQPSQDCKVGHWSVWSVCSKLCDIGEMHRYRKVKKHSKHGGRQCPPLQESKCCGTPVDCYT